MNNINMLIDNNHKPVHNNIMLFNNNIQSKGNNINNMNLQTALKSIKSIKS